MGYVVDHWVTVTGTNRGETENELPASEQAKLRAAWGSSTPVHEAREIALKIFAPASVSAVMPGMINHQEHLSICPDSSKSGWDEANSGHRRRAKFISSLVKARVQERLIVGFTVFGIGEDGDRATASIMHSHDPLFYALQEGESIAATLKQRRVYNKKATFTLEEALTPLDLLVPGDEKWKERVRKIWSSNDTDSPFDNGPKIDVLKAEVMILASLLDIPDKYDAFEKPKDLLDAGRAFYDHLLSDAKRLFPGAVTL